MPAIDDIFDAIENIEKENAEGETANRSDEHHEGCVVFVDLAWLKRPDRVPFPIKSAGG